METSSIAPSTMKNEVAPASISAYKPGTAGTGEAWAKQPAASNSKSSSKVVCALAVIAVCFFITMVAVICFVVYFFATVETVVEPESGNVLPLIRFVTS